jgi:hypothetical protein
MSIRAVLLKMCIVTSKQRNTEVLPVTSVFDELQIWKAFYSAFDYEDDH